jgi:hypothetical protein
MSETPFKHPSELDINGHRYVHCNSPAEQLLAAYEAAVQAKDALIAIDIKRIAEIENLRHDRKVLRDRLSDLEGRLAKAKPDDVEGGTALRPKVAGWTIEYWARIYDRLTEANAENVAQLAVIERLRVQRDELLAARQPEKFNGYNAQQWYESYSNVLDKLTRLRAELNDTERRAELVDSLAKADFLVARGEIAGLRAILAEVRKALGV